MNRDRFWVELEAVHAEAERFCRRLSATREDGDDLYQEALLRAFDGCEGLKDPSAFRPWLYRIIINLFRNRQRRAWWYRLVHLTPEVEDTTPGEDPSGKHWANRQLTRAFAVVTAEEKALVVLHEIEGWTIPDLADLYKKPTGTIKARLSRARSKMRQALLRTAEETNKPRTTNTKLVEAPICVVTKPESE